MLCFYLLTITEGVKSNDHFHEQCAQYPDRSCPADNHGENYACGEKNQKNPLGCMCAYNNAPLGRPGPVCVQNIGDCMNAVVCNTIPAPAPQLYQPDPQDQCYASGGICLRTCCSETAYICHQSCI